MGRPSLSVVIPVRDGAGSICRAVDSVLDHVGNHDLEIIIVDDGSRDGTNETVHAAYGAERRVRLMRHRRNLGAGVARMTGMAHAQGEYLAFLDADDYYAAAFGNHLDKALELRPDVMCFRYAVRHHSGGHRDRMLALDDVVWAGLVDRCDTLVDIVDVPTVLRIAAYPWNRLISRTFAERIGLRFSATPVLNDVHAHWQALTQAHRLLLSWEPGVVHVWDRGGRQLTNTAGSRRLMSLSVLDEVATTLAQDPSRQRFRPYFDSFRLDLLAWAYRDATPGERAEIVRRHGPLVPKRPSRSRSMVDATSRVLVLGAEWSTVRQLHRLGDRFEIVGLLDWALRDAGAHVAGHRVFHPSERLPLHDLVVVCDATEAARSADELRALGLCPVGLEEVFPGAHVLYGEIESSSGTLGVVEPDGVGANR